MAAYADPIVTTRRSGLPVAVSAALLVIAARSSIAQIPSPDSLRRLLARATYVFQGSVQRWNAVADPALSVNPRHGVVRVLEVFVCPVAVGEFGHEDVTVRFANPQAAPPGTRAWFLGTGWAIGDRVATSIVSLIPVKTDAQSDSVRANLIRAVRLSTRDALRATAAAADSIVIATVRLVGPPHAQGGEPRSEYQEEWSTVNIVVDSARGITRDTARKRVTFGAGWVATAPSQRNMTILIPAYSNDTSSVARLTPGQRRLLLLDRAARRPSLRAVDSTATAFIPNRSGIRALSDTGFLGQTLPNPTLGVQPVHQCATPFR
jgi:hypothetical protein